MTIHIISQVGTLTRSNKLQKKAIRYIRLTNIKGTAEVLSAAADDDDDKDEQNLSEVTHVRMFTQLLDDLLMNDTSINFYDGETVSRSAKRMKILTGDESEY